MTTLRLLILSLGILAYCANANTGSRLIATGGITGFEGTAGGGITPWAFISGYGSKEEINGTANIQHLSLDDYTLNTFGASLGIYDLIELSVQRQTLAISSGITSNVFSLLTNGAITAAQSTRIDMDIVTAKINVLGDGVFKQQSWVPQVALGAQYKKHRDFNTTLLLPDGTGPLPNQGVARLLGARDDSGTDFFISATKLYLGQVNGFNLLTNLTARYTKANTFGLLGFGSASDDSYNLEWEGSLALLTSPSTVVGVEFRTQTNRLGGLAEEDTVTDAFIAYFPNKSFSLTAAYVNLGNLPMQPSSSGFYLTATANF